MEPRRGTQCAALFDDGKGPAWYRAQVIGATPLGTRVRYIDHGNCTTVKPSQLRPLDSSYFAFPPQARECVMAFMRVPSLDQDFGRDAAMGLNDLGWGKELLGRALGRDGEGRLVRWRGVLFCCFRFSLVVYGCVTRYCMACLWRGILPPRE